MKDTKGIICIHADVMNHTSGSEFKTMCLMNCIGNFNRRGRSEDMETYVYKKDIKEQLEELKKQGIKVPTERTVYSHLKKLSKIFFDNSDIPLVKMENSNHGIVYKIKQSYDNKYFVTVPYEQLRELLSHTNAEMVKLYCIFCYKCSDDEWTKITNGYLCAGLGKDDTLANKNYISRMISVLLKLGHIKREHESYPEANEKGEEVVKTYNYYKLTTFEEWKTLKY